MTFRVTRSDPGIDQGGTKEADTDKESGNKQKRERDPIQYQLLQCPVFVVGVQFTSPGHKDFSDLCNRHINKLCESQCDIVGNDHGRAEKDPDQDRIGGFDQSPGNGIYKCETTE